MPTASYSLSNLLFHCAQNKNLPLGKSLHAHIIKIGSWHDISLGNGIVNMYAKCQLFDQAHHAFDEMRQRDVVSFNSLINSYSQEGPKGSSFALILFKRMRIEGGVDILPSAFTFAGVFTAAASFGSGGREAHCVAVKTGICGDVFVGSSLLNMYCKLGFVSDARKVFDRMPDRNSVSWAAMISGYAVDKCGVEAFELFKLIVDEGECTANEFVITSVLSAVSLPEFVKMGRQVHGVVVKSGLLSFVTVENSLVTLYSKCGCLDDAVLMFALSRDKTAITWSAMVTGYAQNGESEKSLKLFSRMQAEGVLSSEFTLVGVLNACSDQMSLFEGKQVHAYLVKLGFEFQVYVRSALVDMYAKCGTGRSLVDTRKAFDRMVERNVMSWTATIAAYVQNGGHDIEAIKLFLEMIISGKVHPNHFTYSSILKACANIGDAELGEQVHAHVVKSGLSSINFVGNSLVSMYSQAGRMEEARKAFEILFDKNLVTYNAIVDGYIKNLNTEEAFELVRQTENMAIGVNAFTFASLLSAAASIGAMSKGQQLHAQLLKAGFMSDICVGNALVSVYSRCGNIEDASTVFEDMSNRNVISWTSMITGFAKHGHAHQALAVFDKMTSEGIRPNEVTYVAVLSACSHVGLVREGYANFDLMQRRYGLVPRMEHYACMVDLLGRVGLLNEAFEFIKSMPFRADALVWRTLLGACRVHKHVELGEIAAKRILELEPKDPAAHVLLSNLYAMAGKWDGVAKIRKGMKEKGLNKEAGLSWVEIDNEIHKFHVGDTSHARAREIFNKLDELVVKIKAMGYVVDTEFVLHDLDDELKEKYILQHSEKIAVAFGLISTTTPRPIRVFKNLRVCGDCHNAIKFISKATGREIIVRDSNRFHRFINGECSCGEYW